MKNFFLILALIMGIVGCRDTAISSTEIVLRDKWKFKLGDSPSFSKTDLDESGWSTVEGLKSFSEIGLSQYDGPAWYRFKVIIPSTLKQDKDVKKLEFFLGPLDGFDQLYLNGVLLGSNNITNDTTFISNNSQRGVSRRYEMSVNNKVIKWDQENTVAIRIFNQEGDGGLKSKVFLRSSKLELSKTSQLGSKWAFIKGDSAIYSSLIYHPFSGDSIYSGKTWEAQGIRDYDGFAWYRLNFDLPAEWKNENLEKHTIQIDLGNIDDLDQVYFNNKLIGENGRNIFKGNVSLDTFTKHSTLVGLHRIYTISANDPLIHWDSSNLLAVRVFDSGGDAGVLSYPRLTFANMSSIAVDNKGLYKINEKNVLDTVSVIDNMGNAPFRGTVTYHVTYDNGQDVINKSFPITIPPQSAKTIPISLPFTKENLNLLFRIDDSSGSTIFYDELKIPFVLYKRKQP